MNAPIFRTAAHTARPSRPASQAITSRAMESLGAHGDLSGLNASERARYYVEVCEGLGLNPTSRPLDYITLDGRLVLYATRGATDQLAAQRMIRREIVDGPKVIDLAGIQLVFAVCRATLPNGRVETATATCARVDPVNALMKVETKAKRRATLSILGLGILDEMEVESIPHRAHEAPVPVPASGGPAPRRALTHDPAADPAPPEPPPALEAFYARLTAVEAPSEALRFWLKHRASIEGLSSLDRGAAWKALCDRTAAVGTMKNADAWLKRALADEESIALVRSAA